MSTPRRALSPPQRREVEEVATEVLARGGARFTADEAQVLVTRAARNALAADRAARDRDIWSWSGPALELAHALHTRLLEDREDRQQREAA